MSSFVFSQNLSMYGKYSGQFYSLNDFNSSAQIWTGTQGLNDKVYFGNDTEILSFNGITWEIIQCDEKKLGEKKSKIVSKTKVSKLFTSKNGNIFVGRSDNFGVLEYSKNGKVIYQPLMTANFENEIGRICNIFEFEEAIYFVGKSKIFKYKNKKITTIKTIDFENHVCLSASKVDGGTLIAFKSIDPSIESRKYLYFDEKLETSTEVITPENNSLKFIDGSFFMNNAYFLFTEKGEAYKFIKRNKKIIFEKEEHKFPALLKDLTLNQVKLFNNLIYISSKESGLIILDNNGKIFRKFDLNDGMENIHVIDFFHDQENNLWLTLDNGIHFFETSSPLTLLNKNEGLVSSINKIEFIGNKDYVANGTSIYESYIEDYHKKFREISIVDEQTWDLLTVKTSFGNKTIAIGNSGIYELNFKTNKIDTIAKEYAWTIHQNPNNKDEIFVGLDNSLAKLSLTKKGWEYKELIVDTDGEIRKLTVHKNKLIFGVKDIGVYVFDLNTKTYYLAKNKFNKKLTTPYFIETFQDVVYVGMTTGLYYLDPQFKKLIPFKEVNGKFVGNKNLQIHRVINIDNKKLFLATHNEKNEVKFEHGWLEKRGNKWTWNPEPFALFNINKSGLAYDIRQKSKNEIWLGLGQEIYIFNESQNNNLSRTFTLSFDNISINNKIEIYDPRKANPLNDLEYKNNTLKFVFHANSFMGMNHMKYRFKLDNYTDEWSEWSTLNFVDFKKISEGTYKLKIQAKNMYGFESEILEYDFRILPPWYRSWWAFTLYFITFIFLIYLTIQLSIRRIKNQNIKLEATVKERTSEIATQNQQLEIQKEEIEQKTKDIVDSIVYAKRIQETILPTKERLNSFFNEHFVFYRPKDIVSGDFYWARKKGNLAIFSALDCTGHGVPGALVSIVGNAALLRCVNEHKLTEPSEILDKLRDIVVRSFDATGQSDVKDGMDMSLCTLDLDTLKLKFSGANNECFIIRDKELIELKPDKQPIGKFSHATPFTQREIQLQKGDCVYQYTDGFVDQFGGERGKKLKSRPFKDFINIISHLSMEEQHEKIKNFFDSWIENYEQVDDVCVFGIKV